MKKYIKQVNYIDKEINECEVILNDGQFEIMCFAQPYNENNDFSINAFLVQNIMTALDNNYSVVKSKNGHFAYSIQGKLLSKNRGEVKVGEFYIKLENPQEIPKDINEGEFVQFNCQRLDLN